MMVRMVRQFHLGARFEPDSSRLSAEAYAPLVEAVVRRDPRHPDPDEPPVVIPGYADLRSFSLDHEDVLTVELFRRLLGEEYEKLRGASDRDVHDDSKETTLPIAREIVESYVSDDVKLPWAIDLLNINLDNADLAEARRRIEAFTTAFRRDGTRTVSNPDFELER